MVASLRAMPRDQSLAGRDGRWRSAAGLSMSAMIVHACVILVASALSGCGAVSVQCHSSDGLYPIKLHPRVAKALPFDFSDDVVQRIAKHVREATGAARPPESLAVAFPVRCYEPASKFRANTPRSPGCFSIGVGSEEALVLALGGSRGVPVRVVREDYMLPNVEAAGPLVFLVLCSKGFPRYSLAVEVWEAGRLKLARHDLELRLGMDGRVLSVEE